MSRVVLAMAIASLAGIATPAFAQGDSNRSTTYDFIDEPVVGEGADGPKEILIVRRSAERASLIHIRTHFVPEMLKTVEEL